MKCYFTLAALILPFSLVAQDSMQTKKEMGIFFESNVMDSYGHRLVSTGGIMYKHVESSLLAFTGLAGYTYSYDGNVNYRNPEKATADTMMWKATSINTNLATLGFGIEFRRNFYKKLSLLGGVETRISYGTVMYDTSIVAEINYNSTKSASPSLTQIYTSYVTYPGRELVAAQAAIIPYLGLKVTLGRFNIGYTISNYLYTYRIESDNISMSRQTEFGLGVTHQRLFATYGF